MSSPGIDSAEILFCLLDSLDSCDLATEASVYSTVVDFANSENTSHFVILASNAIISFLQVSHISINHQISLLRLLAFILSSYTVKKESISDNYTEDDGSNLNNLATFILNEYICLKQSDSRRVALLQVLLSLSLLIPEDLVDMLLSVIDDNRINVISGGISSILISISAISKILPITLCAKGHDIIMNLLSLLHKAANSDSVYKVSSIISNSKVELVRCLADVADAIRCNISERNMYAGLIGTAFDALLNDWVPTIQKDKEAFYLSFPTLETLGHLAQVIDDQQLIQHSPKLLLVYLQILNSLLSKRNKYFPIISNIFSESNKLIECNDLLPNNTSTIRWRQFHAAAFSAITPLLTSKSDTIAISLHYSILSGFRLFISRCYIVCPQIFMDKSTLHSLHNVLLQYCAIFHRLYGVVLLSGYHSHDDAINKALEKGFINTQDDFSDQVWTPSVFHDIVMTHNELISCWKTLIQKEAIMEDTVTFLHDNIDLKSANRLSSMLILRYIVKDIPVKETSYLSSITVHETSSSAIGCLLYRIARTTLEQGLDYCIAYLLCELICELAKYGYLHIGSTIAENISRDKNKSFTTSNNEGLWVVPSPFSAEMLTYFLRLLAVQESKALSEHKRHIQRYKADHIKNYSILKNNQEVNIPIIYPPSLWDIRNNAKELLTETLTTLVPELLWPLLIDAVNHPKLGSAMPTVCESLSKSCFTLYKKSSNPAIFFSAFEYQHARYLNICDPYKIFIWLCMYLHDPYVYNGNLAYWSLQCLQWIAPMIHSSPSCLWACVPSERLQSIISFMESISLNKRKTADITFNLLQEDTDAKVSDELGIHSMLPINIDAWFPLVDECISFILSGISGDSSELNNVEYDSNSIENIPNENNSVISTLLSNLLIALFSACKDIRNDRVQKYSDPPTEFQRAGMYSLLGLLIREIGSSSASINPILGKNLHMMRGKFIMTIMDGLFIPDMANLETNTNNLGNDNSASNSDIQDNKREIKKKLEYMQAFNLGTMDIQSFSSAIGLSSVALQRSCGRCLGYASNHQSNFIVVSEYLLKLVKSEAANKRSGAFSFFGKSLAVVQAEQLRSTLIMGIGHCLGEAPLLLCNSAIETIKRMLQVLECAIKDEKEVTLQYSALRAIQVAYRTISCDYDTALTISARLNLISGKSSSEFKKNSFNENTIEIFSKFRDKVFPYILTILVFPITIELPPIPLNSTLLLTAASGMPYSATSSISSQKTPTDPSGPYIRSMVRYRDFPVTNDTSLSNGNINADELEIKSITPELSGEGSSFDMNNETITHGPFNLTLAVLSILSENIALNSNSPLLSEKNTLDVSSVSPSYQSAGSLPISNNLNNSLLNNIQATNSPQIVPVYNSDQFSKNLVNSHGFGAVNPYNTTRSGNTNQVESKSNQIIASYSSILSLLPPAQFNNLLLASIDASTSLLSLSSPLQPQFVPLVINSCLTLLVSISSRIKFRADSNIYCQDTPNHINKNEISKILSVLDNGYFLEEMLPIVEDSITLSSGEISVFQILASLGRLYMTIYTSHMPSWIGLTHLLEGLLGLAATTNVSTLRYTCIYIVYYLLKEAPLVEIIQASTLNNMDEDTAKGTWGAWMHCIALILGRACDSCYQIQQLAYQSINECFIRSKWTQNIQLYLKSDFSSEESGSTRKSPTSSIILSPTYLNLLHEMAEYIPSYCLRPLCQHILPSFHDADKMTSYASVETTRLLLSINKKILENESFACNLVSSLLNEIPAIIDIELQNNVYLLIRNIASYQFSVVTTEIFQLCIKKQEYVDDSEDILYTDHNSNSDEWTKVDLLASLGDKDPDTVDSNKENSMKCVVDPIYSKAISCIGRDRNLLLKSFKYLTDILNNTQYDSIFSKKTCNTLSEFSYEHLLIRSSTLAIGILLKTNDSSIKQLAKKHFPELMATLLLRCCSTMGCINMGALESSDTLRSLFTASNDVDMLTTYFDTHQLQSLLTQPGMFDRCIMNLLEYLFMYRSNIAIPIILFIKPFLNRINSLHCVGAITILATAPLGIYNTMKFGSKNSSEYLISRQESSNININTKISTSKTDLQIDPLAESVLNDNLSSLILNILKDNKNVLVQKNGYKYFQWYFWYCLESNTSLPIDFIKMYLKVCFIDTINLAFSCVQANTDIKDILDNNSNENSFGNFQESKNLSTIPIKVIGECIISLRYLVLIIASKCNVRLQSIPGHPPLYNKVVINNDQYDISKQETCDTAKKLIIDFFVSSEILMIFQELIVNGYYRTNIELQSLLLLLDILLLVIQVWSNNTSDENLNSIKEFVQKILVTLLVKLEDPILDISRASWRALQISLKIILNKEQWNDTISSLKNRLSNYKVADNSSFILTNSNTINSSSSIMSPLTVRNNSLNKYYIINKFNKISSFYRENNENILNNSEGNINYRNNGIYNYEYILPSHYNIYFNNKNVDNNFDLTEYTGKDNKLNNYKSRLYEVKYLDECELLNNYLLPILNPNETVSYQDFLNCIIPLMISSKYLKELSPKNKINKLLLNVTKTNDECSQSNDQILDHNNGIQNLNYIELSSNSRTVLNTSILNELQMNINNCYLYLCQCRYYFPKEIWDITEAALSTIPKELEKIRREAETQHLLFNRNIFGEVLNEDGENPEKACVTCKSETFFSSMKSSSSGTVYISGFAQNALSHFNTLWKSREKMEKEDIDQSKKHETKNNDLDSSLKKISDQDKDNSSDHIKFLNTNNHFMEQLLPKVDYSILPESLLQQLKIRRMELISEYIKCPPLLRNVQHIKFGDGEVSEGSSAILASTFIKYISLELFQNHYTSEYLMMSSYTDISSSKPWSLSEYYSHQSEEVMDIIEKLISLESLISAICKQISTFVAQSKSPSRYRFAKALANLVYISYKP
ncbi:uncharacterized protein CMU_026670 [Cryptosporidium muris RN66]|uniref:HEAT repeat family protein n=1 Tax=Cryptosporidium muris (strain RN66) TaxID=441375 RepID=B6ABA7_CRYMR|nr:uncharacterized protein CMU_026670 [Cryptosporidium muris RN66]EEA05659.1 hypothetical protein, conserved [Cryptosporidium muris RN66]|eukprot:XP_002140008.1 hypothetical protein [Cryptosporidium muris RN66]